MADDTFAAAKISFYVNIMELPAVPEFTKHEQTFSEKTFLGETAFLTKYSMCEKFVNCTEISFEPLEPEHISGPSSAC